MNSGMYSALSGNIAAMRRMDVISNNLANVNTPGFKKDRMLFEGMLAGSTTPPAVPQGSTADPILQKESLFIDYAPGPVNQTGNPLDLAIEGDGFLTVTTPNGPAYTRQGNLRLASDGTLVTIDGYPVQGDNGTIRIQGGKVEIDAKGAVSVDGAPVATIKVVDFPRPYQLKKLGQALLVPEDPQVTPQAARADIRQGSLEGSNVESITEMVQMIETNRYFDACQRAIRGFDDMAAKAVSDLGRL